MPAAKSKSKPAVRRTTQRRGAARTFTVRDLSRQTAAVLAASAKFGSVDIAARDGNVFSLKFVPRQTSQTEAPDWEARRKRMAELGMVPLSREQSRQLDQMIAGEQPDVGAA